MRLTAANTNTDSSTHGPDVLSEPRPLGSGCQRLDWLLPGGRIGLSGRNALAVVQPGKRFYRPPRFLLGDAQLVEAL